MINKFNNLKGIFFILIGMGIAAIHDNFVKILSSDTSLYLIYSIRAFMGMLLILLFFKLTKKPIIIKTHFPFLTLLRGLLFFSAFSLFFISITVLKYPIAVTLFFASPFFVTILSKFILKEKIGIKRWIAVAVGFCGVILVMNPDFENFNIYTLFPVYTAFAYAITQIIQHKTAHKDSLLSQTFHIFFVTSVLCIIVGFFLGGGQHDIYDNDVLKFIFRKWEISYDNLLLLILVGLTGVTALLFLFQAYRIASPPTIAPFEYILILYAFVIGWIFWEEQIDLETSLGLVLIVGAGLYTFSREVANKKPLSVEKPLR